MQISILIIITSCHSWSSSTICRTIISNSISLIKNHHLLKSISLKLRDTACPLIIVSIIIWNSIWFDCKFRTMLLEIKIYPFIKVRSIILILSLWLISPFKMLLNFDARLPKPISILIRDIFAWENHS